MLAAAKAGTVEAIAEHLEENPEDLNTYWLTFLGYACAHGNYDVVEFLVQQDGIDLNRGIQTEQLEQVLDDIQRGRAKSANK